MTPTDRTKLADEIEASEGLAMIGLPDGREVKQLGIRKTALIVAALRASNNTNIKELK